jgi:hypothetical protein
MKGSLFVLLIVALGQTDQRSVTSSSDGETTALRRFHEIERDLRELFQREARAASKQERAVAAYDMTYLFVQIQLDPRRATSPTLAEYQSRLRARLMRIKRDVERDLRRDNQHESAPSAAGSEEHSASAVSRVPATSAHQPSFGDVPDARGGRAGAPDWGPALVELIEHTIAPEFWDVNGGPGSIRYYYPLRVLVVRATDDLHHRLGNALNNLRAAGP